MGKIFGISDLPVSIPTTPLQILTVPEPAVVPKAKKPYIKPQVDVYVPSTPPVKKGNVAKKLLSHLKRPV